MRLFDQVAITFGKNVSVYRNEENIWKGKGVIQKNSAIDLPHDANVQPGDIVVLELSQEKNKVERIETIPCIMEDAIDCLRVHYEKPATRAPKYNKTIINVGTAYNSAFGDNATSNISITFNNIEQVIRDNGHDPKEFRELLDVLKESLSKEQCSKGFLSQFGDIISKHAWLSGAIAQSLLGYFTGNVIR